MSEHNTFICELDRVGLISFNGPDAETFLHGQVTCDIKGLPPGTSRYGGYCSPKGRLLATFLVWRTPDGFMLQLPLELRESVQKRLSMFILRAKVKAADATAEYARFGVVGPGAQAVVARVLQPPPASVHGVLHSGKATMLTLPGDRVEILVPVSEADGIRNALRGAATEAPDKAWHLAEIRAGIATILPQTQEAFVPQMVNLDLIGGVSYSKGCYPGQEIVARTHYLGRLKQRAYLAHVPNDGEPRPGDALYSADFGEQASGTIVNSAAAPGGGYDVIAVIQMASAKAGAVHWGAMDGPLLELKELPYALAAA